MSEYKSRHLFPGGNTSNGFYSFYKYIVPLTDSNRVICLKGGPGTGKSSFMKKIGKYFGDLGYSIEYHHCSSDNDSLDGVVISELNVAILDGTSPHIVDPVYPGAVDEIINLGEAFNIDSLTTNRDAIINITEEISKNFARAYKFFESAKYIHDDWASLNSEAVDFDKILNLVEELKSKILTGNATSYGKERHIFSTAFTPNGIISYNSGLALECDNLYVLKGGPGLKKSYILKEIGTEAQKEGHYVEYFHDPLVTDRIENIIIPDIKTGVFTSNEISRLNYNGYIYNLKEFCNSNVLFNNSSEILYDKREFDKILNKGLSCITNSHILHDRLEEYYIGAMNFDVVDQMYENTIKMIKTKFIQN